MARRRDNTPAWFLLCFPWNCRKQTAAHSRGPWIFGGAVPINQKTAIQPRINTDGHGCRRFAKIEACIWRVKAILLQLLCSSVFSRVGNFPALFQLLNPGLPLGSISGAAGRRPSPPVRYFSNRSGPCFMPVLSPKFLRVIWNKITGERLPRKLVLRLVTPEPRRSRRKEALISWPTHPG